MSAPAVNPPRVCAQHQQNRRLFWVEADICPKRGNLRRSSSSGRSHLCTKGPEPALTCAGFPSLAGFIPVQQPLTVAFQTLGVTPADRQGGVSGREHRVSDTVKEVLVSDRRSTTAVEYVGASLTLSSHGSTIFYVLSSLF